MSNLQLDAQYEIFSKAALAYSNPAYTKLKPLAEQLFDTQGYIVSRVFDSSNPANQFKALGLISKDGSKPPVLVIPGGGGENAGNPRTIASEEFEANKQGIRDWLISTTNDRQINPQGIKPDVTGASWGGAFTQLTASEFPTLIGSAVSFISTGIDRETADNFIENGGNPSQVRHYVNNGDKISLLGEAFIPGKVTVGNYEIPVLPAANGVEYGTRKHASAILADLSSLLPDTTDPIVAQLRAESDLPADLTLSDMSVDELNRPDFTWNGKDWQALRAQVQTNNPNLAALLDRQGLEELRDNDGAADGGTRIFDLVNRAITGTNPVPPEQVNRPTAGNDILFGSDCHDRIDGLAGDDYIRGGTGNDTLYGNNGKDALIGGAGNDILCGGSDNDVLTGNSGIDRFVFGDSTPFNAATLGVDRINDFAPSEDLIGLSKATFTQIGENFSRSFATVNDDLAAETSKASIVYNASNGKLFYNTNGVDSGFGEGGQFASIFGQPTLSAENFTLDS
jgi:serralysin